MGNRVNEGDKIEINDLYNVCILDLHEYNLPAGILSGLIIKFQCLLILDLSGYKSLNPEEIQDIFKLTKLKELNFSNCNLKKNSLIGINSLTNLERDCFYRKIKS